MCSSSYHLGSLGFYRDCVAGELADEDKPFEPNFSDAADCVFPDVHIASACLQKTLRRGELSFALATARYLLRQDPARLWRRLSVCAFEDFGLVDLAITARVVAVASSKSFRLSQGEERVLVHLIERLCELPKDRRLDDLYALGAEVFVRPAYLRTLQEGPHGAVLAPLVHETAGLIRSCERAVPRHSFRALSLESCERMLARMQSDGRSDDGLVELCSKGLQTSRCLLPLLLPLAIEATEASGGRGEAIEVPFPPVPLIGGVPAYAFDGFTRSGRAVLGELERQEPRLSKQLAHLPAAARLAVLHHLLFVAEGGCSSPVLSDPLSESLKLQAIVFAARLPHQEALRAVTLMTELLPTVHTLRSAMAPRVPTSPKEDLS